MEEMSNTFDEEDTAQLTNRGLLKFPPENLETEDTSHLETSPELVERRCIFDGDSSGEDEEGLTEEARRATSELDVIHLVGKGSFLPVALLLQREFSDPRKLIIDRNTGATCAHYGAHFGNLKFVRWYVQ